MDVVEKCAALWNGGKTSLKKYTREIFQYFDLLETFSRGFVTFSYFVWPERE